MAKLNNLCVRMSYCIILGLNIEVSNNISFLLFEKMRGSLRLFINKIINPIRFSDDMKIHFRAKEENVKLLLRY